MNLIIKDQSFLVRGAAIWALQQLDNKNNLKNIHLIGGAKVAMEIDAKKAIRDGVKVALSL